MCEVNCAVFYGHRTYVTAPWTNTAVRLPHTASRWSQVWFGKIISCRAGGSASKAHFFPLDFHGLNTALGARILLVFSVHLTLTQGSGISNFGHSPLFFCSHAPLLPLLLLLDRPAYSCYIPLKDMSLPLTSWRLGQRTDRPATYEKASR